MAGFSQYTQEAIANWLRGTDMPPAPTGLYVALSLGEIDDDGNGFTEPADVTGYSRQAVTLSAPAHTPGVGTVVKNATPVIFGPTTTVWTGVQSVALLDAGGNILVKGNLVAPRTAPVGDTLSFGVGTLEFSVV